MSSVKGSIGSEARGSIVRPLRKSVCQQPAASQREAKPACSQQPAHLAPSFGGRLEVELVDPHVGRVPVGMNAMGCDAMRLDGMGWDGTGWDGMGWDGMGWDGLGWDGMGWDGMGWDGTGWDGMA
jgi:hypothetical protein